MQILHIKLSLTYFGIILIAVLKHNYMKTNNNVKQYNKKTLVYDRCMCKYLHSLKTVKKVYARSN